MVKQTIQIYARLKPTKKDTAVYSVDNEEQRGDSLEFVVPKDLLDGFINNKREIYRFRFQKVFDQSTKQEAIFEAIAKPVADNVLAGYNGTIFAYGQTGSGKTFTITGGVECYNDRGIIPRTLSYLYQHFNQNSSIVYTTHISYLEIYNEVGYDLLDPRHEANNLENLPTVTIMEDPEQNIHLKNLSLQPSANEEAALNLLFLGDTNRMIAETPMNQASSRSHCIFTIHLCSREPGSATVRCSKLHLVDLAGSERVGKTGVEGQILTEAKYINLSLHYLEQVITALSEKNRSHIPYRNSMMTSVLRDSLGGNCMTTMIAMVSVEKRNVDESISTCRFAQRVAMIKNEALLNEELDPSLEIIRLKKEIRCLKEELAMLTGEQRGDELTQDEIQGTLHQLKVFLDDPDLTVTLDLGPDMRKIRHCFSYLKERLREKPVEVRIENGAQNRAGDFSPLSSSSITDRPASPANGQLLKLKEMLTQRDNEISILVSMLKKEKCKVQEANAQLAKFGGSQSSLQSSLTCTETEKRKDHEASGDAIHTEHVKCKGNGAELSMGRQEAFEVFRSEHEDNITIEDNKVIMKRRVAEAKELGKQVNQARSKVNELKKQLETRRMQIAAQGVIGNQPRTESDPVEEQLRINIEEEKKIYKSTFECLKGLKTEIEHLQHLHQRSKIKLQKDFQDWWTQETARLQQIQCSESARAGQSQDNFPPSSSLLHDQHIAIQDSAQTHQPPPPTQERRALSFAGPVSASIPLIGEQQTDADILAFIKARQNLLIRTALCLSCLWAHMALLQVAGARFSWTTPLALFQFTYLLFGATIFQLLEKEAESQNRNHFQMEKLFFLTNYTCLDEAALEKFVQVILDARECGVNPSGNSTSPSNWDFGSSFFFAGTVVTTIGYGNLSPTTYPGQVFCVFYALCGIPLNLAFLNQLSKCLSTHLGHLEHRMMSIVPHKQYVEVLAVALFLLMGNVLFLIFPPVIFSFVEGWSYGEGFYYTFITLSTIGFGDYVVGNGQDKQKVSVYRCLAAIWIIFALAWLAVLLNIGARILENFFSLKQPPISARDERRSSVRKQDGGLTTPENQPQEKQKEKGFFKIRMV